MYVRDVVESHRVPDSTQARQHSFRPKQVPRDHTIPIPRQVPSLPQTSNAHASVSVVG